MASLLLKLREQNKQLTLVWGLLLALTLFSAAFAEQGASGALLVVFVCISFAVKGSLVTERLMGLYTAIGNARWLMLAYFVVLPILIGGAILFPDLVVRVTTL
ncbi:MAG: hypothetical protein H6995_00870 [Pseudomonadales bacterium]|nr:hypothetical protein [Pseudomonadales bacterium]MCP5213549.1 hypothetical protein [Pseudomonadales bacterium]